MTSLIIRLLGSFEANVGSGSPATFPTKKARALLAYLALRPGTMHSRDEVADLLWSTSGDEQARGSLRRTLSDLRKSLSVDEAGWLISNGDLLMLDSEGVDVDTATFECLAENGSPAALEQAVELYKGELLAGFGLREQGFEEWLRTERERLRMVALKSLGRLLEHYAATDAFERGIQAGIRLLALDPVNERAHRALMSLYARQGRRAEALRQYRTCREVLSRELGVGPDAATEALHRALQDPSGALDIRTANPIEPAIHSATPRPPEKPSICVLPFVNLSGDPEQDYFADGLVEDITAALSRVSALWVTARASTAAYKGRVVDVKQVARELGVRYVMEGSVRKSGNRQRVTIQLADAATGRQVWAERYDRPVADIFDIQDEIARSVVASTETQIMMAEGQAFGESRLGSAKARDLITRAAWSRVFDQTPEAIADAFELTEEAIRLDPTYPQAHRMRATVLLNKLWLGYVPHRPEVLAQAMEFARAALRMAPRDELAHLVMAWGWAYAAPGHLEEAVAECERGIEINPNCSLLYGNRALYLAMLGRSREAIETNQLALQLNPRDPSNFWRTYTFAVAHFVDMDYAAAMQEAKKVALSRPQLQSAIIWAAAAAGLDNAKEERAAVENCLALRPDLRVDLVVPHLMLRFTRDADHERLLGLLRKAGLPE